MHSLIALLVAAAAACAIARPGPSTAPEPGRAVGDATVKRSYLGDYLLPRLMLPRYFGYEESPRAISQREMEHEWLNKEIDRISAMEAVEDDSFHPYEMDAPQWMPPDPYAQSFEQTIRLQNVATFIPDSKQNNYETIPLAEEITMQGIFEKLRKSKAKIEIPDIDELEKKKAFALTPIDEGYFEPAQLNITDESAGLHEGGGSDTMELEPPRQIRQNPTLAKSMNLVSTNLNQLQNRANKDYYKIPVSLLPTNLRWLKHNHRNDDEESQSEAPEGTSKPGRIQAPEAADPADSIYGIALVAAVGTSLAMTIVGFAFGWYTLSKKAKAAADVDYPAYGVTGPTMDSTGDRKLAHSAHMYHYQHQKQQIIAMERNGLEHRAGSVSDPESEEENEEGDYTVYECPGFATTGDMEVKNPMFSEEPTPATPGKCELVKPQPKE